MIRFLADENVEGPLIAAIRRYPEVDLLTARDAGLASTPDHKILEWAARENRVVITHDENSMIGPAYARAAQGLPMPGLLVLPRRVHPGTVAEEIQLYALYAAPEEMVGVVRHIHAGAN